MYGTLSTLSFGTFRTAETFSLLEVSSYVCVLLRLHVFPRTCNDIVCVCIHVCVCVDHSNLTVSGGEKTLTSDSSLFWYFLFYISLQLYHSIVLEGWDVLVTYIYISSYGLVFFIFFGVLHKLSFFLRGQWSRSWMCVSLPNPKEQLSLLTPFFIYTNRSCAEQMCRRTLLERWTKFIQERLNNKRTMKISLTKFPNTNISEGKWSVTFFSPFLFIYHYPYICMSRSAHMHFLVTCFTHVVVMFPFDEKGNVVTVCAKMYVFQILNLQYQYMRTSDTGDLRPHTLPVYEVLRY